MFSCGIYKIFKNTEFEVCERLLLKPVFSPGSNWYIGFSFLHHNLRFGLRTLPSLLYILHHQKQSSGAVLQKRCSYKFRKIHKKTRKNRFRHRCFLVNSAKFLKTSFLKNPSDDCFSISTRSVYCPTATIGLFKNDVTHIFWLSIFS